MVVKTFSTPNQLADSQ